MSAPPKVTPARYPEVVAFIDEYLREHSFAPSVREIGVMLGISSSDTAMKHLYRMRAAGLIDWLDDQPRTIHVVRKAAA